jgi:hypothetical protein
MHKLMVEQNTEFFLETKNGVDAEGFWNWGHPDYCWNFR